MERAILVPRPHYWVVLGDINRGLLPSGERKMDHQRVWCPAISISAVDGCLPEWMQGGIGRALGVGWGAAAAHSGQLWLVGRLAGGSGRQRLRCAAGLLWLVSPGLDRKIRRTEGCALSAPRPLGGKPCARAGKSISTWCRTREVRLADPHPDPSIIEADPPRYI